MTHHNNTAEGACHRLQLLFSQLLGAQRAVLDQIDDYSVTQMTALIMEKEKVEKERDEWKKSYKQAMEKCEKLEDSLSRLRIENDELSGQAMRKVVSASNKLNDPFLIQYQSVGTQTCPTNGLFKF